MSIIALQRPDAAISLMGALAWLVLTPILFMLYLTVPVSPDQSLFDYIAWSHLQGDVYYAGVAEQNWPGAMLIHELGIRLFGVHFWTFRAVDFVFLQGTALSGAWLMNRAGLTRGSWAFLVLYPVLYTSSGFWFAGQRDIIAAGFLLTAAACAHGPRSDGGRPDNIGGAVLTGAFVAFAVLMRPTYLSYLVGLAALEVLRFPNEPTHSLKRMARRVGGLFLGFALPLLAVLAGGLALDAVDDFYRQTVLFNIENYQKPDSRSRLFGEIANWLFGSWHWIAGLAATGLAAWFWRDGLTRAQVLLLGLALTGIVSYVAQNQGFEYHLGAVPLVMTALAAAGLDALSRAWAGTPRQGPIAQPLPSRIPILRYGAAAVLMGSLVLCAVGGAKRLSNFDTSQLSTTPPWSAHSTLAPTYADPARPTWSEIETVVARIQKDTTAEDYILQWGRNFEIPFLAERRPSLRFVSAPAVRIMTPAFSAYDAWVEEITRGLQIRRPIYVVIATSELIENGAKGLVPHPDGSAAELMIFEFLTKYAIVYQSDALWILKDPRT